MNTLPPNWLEISSLEQLDDIKTESYQHPILIFKHSTRCVISRTVLNSFKELSLSAKTYYLDLLKHRDISSKIAELYGVEHQSPQVLGIKDGSSVYSASHADILSEPPNL